MHDDVCLITGVGPGTGSALARRFAERYRVAMVARNAERLSDLEAEISGARGYSCDVSDEAQLLATHQKIADELGRPEIVMSYSRPR